MPPHEKETDRLGDINQVKSERAKIFAPFSPLKGMDKAYREKERVIIPKSELLGDRIDEINEKLKSIKKGSIVEVTYYDDGKYTKRCGQVYSISAEKRMFSLDLPIYFDDIYNIEIRESFYKNP